MGRKTNPASGGWPALRRYGTWAAVLFIVLTIVITMIILSNPPVYSSRSTVRIANSSPMKMLEPVTWLSSDSVEDEMAVLESQTARDSVAEKLHLECKPVPDWAPNPFLYQVRRVWSIIFRTTPPTNYAYLEYPTVTQLEMDYPKVRHADLRVAVNKDGTCSLLRKGRSVSTGQIGDTLEADGLKIALEGFTPGVNQRWKLDITEPERVGIDLTKDLSIFRVGARSNTIGVRYQDAHPELAANVVSALMDFYMQRDLNITQQVSRESLDFVESQISAVRGELDDLRGQMKDLLNTKANLLASGNNAGLIDKYLQGGLTLGELRTERGQYKALLKQLDSKEGFLGYYEPTGGSRSLETELIDSIMQTELDLQKELQTKTEQHPDVIKLRESLDKQNDDLRKLLNESLAQVDREVSAAEHQQGSFESLLKLSPTATTELARLDSEITIRSETLGTLYSEQQKAKLQQIAAISTIRMLDPALPDRENISPRILQSVLTAVVFSAFITIALLLGVRVMDTGVRMPSDLASRFQVPVLATLHKDGGGGSDLELSRLRSKLAQLAATEVDKVAVIASHDGDCAKNIAGLFEKLISAGSKGAAVNLKVQYSSLTGLEGLFDQAIAGVDNIVLACPPGVRRLTEIAPMVDEVAGLRKHLAGFILLES